MKTHSSKMPSTPILAILTLVVLQALLLACGSASKPLMLEVPAANLKLLNAAAPAKDFIFYTSTSAQPQTPRAFQSLILCSTDTAVNRLVQIAMGLGATDVSLSITTGGATADCIAEAVKAAAPLIVAKRSIQPPAGVVEVIFK